MLGWFSATFCTSYCDGNENINEKVNIYSNIDFNCLLWWSWMAKCIYLAIHSSFGPRCTGTQCCQQNEHKTLANRLHRCLRHFRSLAIDCYIHETWKWRKRQHYYLLSMILGAKNDYATQRCTMNSRGHQSPEGVENTNIWKQVISISILSLALLREGHS